MKCARVGEKKRIKAVAAGITAVLICTAVMVGFPDGGTVMHCEAREGDTEKEVVDFATAYYEAQTPEGIETLADYVAEPEGVVFQMSVVSLQTLFVHGLEDQENIHAVAYPLSDGEHWMVVTSWEWVIRDLDVTIPGLESLFVGRNQDGKLQIESYSDHAQGSAFLEEMREISLSDEVADRNNEINIKYNDILADYPDVAEWLDEVTDEMDRELAEVADRFVNERQKTLYVVKKGDCLWSIAEERLGDGMLWSDIYETNKAVIGDDPNLIYAGVELELK